MLYPLNSQECLDKETFQNPGSEYRGAPFWAWNCKLDREDLLWQIGILQQMGFGGFHVHSRVGLGTEYMGEEFLSLVKDCNEEAKRRRMLCWLYDEDRWPSGFGGGAVTKDHRYRQRYLVFTPHDMSTRKYKPVYTNRVASTPHGNGELLAKYRISLQNGYLVSYERLPPDAIINKDDNIWYAYLEISPDRPWFNNQAYVNTLDPEAIQRFIAETHEKYYRTLGDDFGKSIPAIFSDEPQMYSKKPLGFAESESEALFPYTDDLEETFRQSYGQSLLEHLPELFWELDGNDVSRIRYLYHDHTSERFASAFADTIGKWCGNHGIMLTGHMMLEESMSEQTCANGEAMRSFRAFQLPGIDLLFDGHEYTTAKQAQSAARQYGREGVLSELYGVTNWDFDFRGHKLQGDWQAAMGITVRVHHLSLVSMAGHAKRDYPASINYQAPWFGRYSYIEDHFARLNTALTRGNPRVRVGVVHPIESYWLHYGPTEQTEEIRAQMEENFQNLIRWLLFGLIDFDYISEALLPEQSPSDGGGKEGFIVGKMCYDVILVPACETLRRSTLDRLKAFAEAGGTVIFAGAPPTCIDALQSNDGETLAANCIRIDFNGRAVLKALEPFRDIDIRVVDNSSRNAVHMYPVKTFFADIGARTHNLFYQLRNDGDCDWLFVCNGFDLNRFDLPTSQKVSIDIKGECTPEIYDTLSGEIKSCPFSYNEGHTIIPAEFNYHDSLLICLRKRKSEPVLPIANDKKVVFETVFPDAVPVTLSEPNALLLDMAEYCLDNGDWHSREELLRIDNRIRTQLGYPLRQDDVMQPWAEGDVSDVLHKVSLRFAIDAECAAKDTWLALENAENIDVLLNGRAVSHRIEGYYVDKSIHKLYIGDIPAGENILELHVPFGLKNNLEWCYLLGGFGVKAVGEKAFITAPVKDLHFGDFTSQGLPFYGGNVTYHLEVGAIEAGEMSIQATQYRGALMSVKMDGAEMGNLVFSPYILPLGKVEQGTHSIELTLYGNRVNSFGCVHNADPYTKYFGPDAWRTEYERWSYDYCLKRTGILISPVVRIEKLF